MRASVARRTSAGLGSPAAFRSRSQERSVDGMGEARSLDYDENEKDGAAASESGETATTVDSNENDDRKSNHSQRGSKSHRRAMSDPFDTPELGGVTDGDLKNSGHCLSDKPSYDTEDEEDEDVFGSEVVIGLPTLPRYPIAQTQDKNCWSQPPVDIFRVRGENYLSDKKKVDSGPYLLRARGCDLFLSDTPQQCVIGDNVRGALGGYLGREPTLLVRFTFPWGLLVLYFEIPQKLAVYMRPSPNLLLDHLSTSERTMAKWLMGDTKYRNERLKLIPYVAEGPWIVKNMVTGKPCLIGKRLPVSYRYTPRNTLSKKEDMLECDFDIGNSSSTAKRIVSVCRRYMSSLTVDIGLLIEGNGQDELPEQMFGSIRVHNADPVKAPTLGKHGTLNQRERTYT